MEGDHSASGEVKQLKYLRKSSLLALSSLAGKADSTRESSRTALAKKSYLEIEVLSTRML